MRAYSLASAAWEEKLEFLSADVPGGALSGRLRLARPGDGLVLSDRASGTLTADALEPAGARRLVLLAAGSGLAPFVGLAKDLEILESYAKIEIWHSAKRRSSWAYEREFKEGFGEETDEAMLAKVEHRGVATGDGDPRLTELASSGALGLDADKDRVMVCAGLPFIKDMLAILKPLGFREGAAGERSNLATEKAFVDR